MARTNPKARAVAGAFREAQRLANADGRAYLVARGARGQRPLVERAADVAVLGSFLAQLVDAGRVLLVAPHDMYRGMAAAEILAADLERAIIGPRS